MERQAVEMTYEEIKAQFDSEWVLVGAPDTDERLNVRGGTVLHHSKDREEVYRRALALRPPRAAVLYTGTMPEDTATVV
ncbi:MAG: hypothetical protein OXJ53_19460 [Gammaproteobacteria bacterium]|nr:hypothetical protein [Gammaproteobacteria bacterium]MDE0270357.1 hypothetical protein [Gammaproteobacteria bacterium]